MTKVYRFYVSSMPLDEVEPFYKHIDGFSFLTEVKIDSQTNKMSYINAYFDREIDIKLLISGFSNVTYTDVTGWDLLNQ